MITWPRNRRGCGEHSAGEDLGWAPAPSGRTTCTADFVEQYSEEWWDVMEELPGARASELQQQVFKKGPGGKAMLRGSLLLNPCQR